MRVNRTSMVLVAVAGLAIPAMAQDSVSINGSLPGDALVPYDPANQCKNYQADLAPRYGSWPGTRFGVVPISKSSKMFPVPGDIEFGSVLMSAQHVSNDTIISNGGTSYKRWHGGVDGAGSLIDWYGVNTAQNAAPNFPDVTSPQGALQLASAFAEFDGEHDAGIASIIEYDRTCPNRLLVRRRIGAVTLQSDALNNPVLGTGSGNIAVGTIDANGNMYIRSDTFGNAAPVLVGDNVFRVRTLARDCALVNRIGVVNDATDSLIIGSLTVHTTPGNVPQSAAGNAAGTYGGVNFSADFITNDGAGVATAVNQGAGWRPGTSSSRGCVGTSINTFPAFNPAGGAVATFALITEDAVTFDKERVSVWGVDPTGAITGAITYPISGNVIINTCDEAVRNNWDTGLGAAGGPTEFFQYGSQLAFNGGNGSIGVGRDGATGEALISGVLYDTGFNDNPINALVVARINQNTGVQNGDWELVAMVNEQTAGAAGTNTPIRGDYGNDGAPFSGDPGEFDGVLDLDPISPTYDAPIGEIRPLFDVTGGVPLGPSITPAGFDGMGNLYFVASVALNKYDNVLGTVFLDTDSALIKARYDDDCDGWRLELLLELGSTTKGRNSTYDYQIQFISTADSNSLSSGAFFSGNVTNENWNKHTPADLNTLPGAKGRADNRALGGLLLSCSITYDRDRDGVFDNNAVGSLDEDYNVALWVGYRPCLADVTTQGKPAGDPLFGVPDEQITGADINYYVNQWVSGNDKADITTQGAAAGTPLFDIPDGIITGADIQRFVNAWVGGCD